MSYERTADYTLHLHRLFAKHLAKASQYSSPGADSRLSEKNEVEQFFYSSSFSASIGPALSYSSSFDKSDVASMAETTNLFRAFVQGTLLTRDNTIDGSEPVEITEVAPTVLKTQDSVTAKLKVE